ncbi:HCL545Cp [Eremothecium sinecaudum]|uniref:HCL545Cp n=1 Tax=Eremothecium sinecaudum TaxID=45286 RepID=A0A120K1Q9_9SACH|nr:HCL545Cp [Eremothecium sinecaudum]AMD19606.1 HCL545Cp [Eremothecium sinecaudum]
MVGFEVTILGSMGGPLDGGTQSLMLKSKGSTNSGYICIDAGSGLRQLIRLTLKSKVWDCNMVESYYRNDFEPAAKFHSAGSSITYGLGTLSNRMRKLMNAKYNDELDAANKLPKTNGNIISAIDRGYELYHEIGEIFITHAHLDHIAALIINSPIVQHGEKIVLGSNSTIDALQKHIFNDQIWPNTVNGKGANLRLQPIETDKVYISRSIPTWKIIAFQSSHGRTIIGQKPFHSMSYLLQDTTDGDSLLVFGDVESDLTSGTNSLVSLWTYLAENVPLSRLRGIIVECSSIDLKDESLLYGHMSPRHIIAELKTLKQSYNKSLDGLSIILTHIKMEPMDEDPRLLILSELREKSLKATLGNIRFSVAIQGYTHFL